MYSYLQQKPNILTDDGQKLFLALRDRTQKLIKESGAVRCWEIMCKTSGDSWNMLACIDRMVELGEIREITSGNVIAQDRVFVSTE